MEQGVISEACGNQSPPPPPGTGLHNVAGEVQQVGRDLDEVVQQAVFGLRERLATLAALTLQARVAALAQAHVGLHADATVAARGLTAGYK